MCVEETQGRLWPGVDLRPWVLWAAGWELGPWAAASWGGCVSLG